MKNLFGILSLLLFVGISQVTAQENTSPVADKGVSKASCSKKCSKSCKASAEKAASMDDMIEKDICEKSGKVSYKRKHVDETNGQVSFTEVAYNESTGAFVDLADEKIAPMGCSKSKKKGCCSAKGSKASAKAMKAEAAPAEAPNSSEGTK
jgi:hypothetical protein